MKRYAAISADIVTSTSLSAIGLSELAKSIRKLLNDLEMNYEGFWGRLVKGDSIECIVPHPENALRIALILKSCVKSFVPTDGQSSSKFKQFGLRLAIGVGDMRINSKKKDIMDGEAIYLSGRAIAEMRDKTTDSFQFVMNNDVSIGAVSIIMMQLNQVINKATRRQCETLFNRLQCKSDAEVAELMDITRSGANNNLRAIGWDVIESSLKYYENLNFGYLPILTDKLDSATKQEVAYLYFMNGNYFKEKNDLSRALEYYKEAYEQCDSDKVKEILNREIWQIYISQEDYEMAISCLWRIITPGENNSSEILSLNDDLNAQTGVDIDKSGFEEILVFLKKALYDNVSKFGENQLENAKIYKNLGLINYRLGRYKEAKESYIKALKIEENLLGDHSLEVATILSILGGVNVTIGNFDEALKNYERALDIRKNDRNANVIDIADSYSDLGGVYYSMGNYEMALEYYSEALKIREKADSVDTSIMATSYSDIAGVYYRKGNYEKALEYYYKALDVRRGDSSVDNPDIAAFYSNIGAVYFSQGDYVKALEYYLKTLAIQEKVLGIDNGDAALSYGNIGSVYYNQGEYDKALEYFFKACDIQERVFGKVHPVTATSYNKIGRVYADQGNFDQALEYYMKALDVQKKELGEEHIDTAISEANIGEMYFKLGKYDEALSYYDKALFIYKNVLGSFHSDTIAISDIIKRLKEKQGDVEDFMSEKELSKGIEKNLFFKKTDADNIQG